MRHRFVGNFERQYADAPSAVQRAFDKQLRVLLEQGYRYRSLDAHPWPAHSPDAWQARVNDAWRFYYFMDGDTYVIYQLQKHPKSPQRGR
jgi:hypothetical protein